MTAPNVVYVRVASGEAVTGVHAERSWFDRGGRLLPHEEVVEYVHLGNATAERDCLRAAVNAYLDVDGSRGRFDAMDLRDARTRLYGLGFDFPEDRVDVPGIRANQKTSSSDDPDVVAPTSGEQEVGDMAGGGLAASAAAGQHPTDRAKQGDAS